MLEKILQKEYKGAKETLTIIAFLTYISIEKSLSEVN